MGKPQRRKKMHFGDTHLQRRWRTRNRHRDLDLVSFFCNIQQSIIAVNKPLLRFYFLSTSHHRLRYGRNKFCHLTHNVNQNI